MWAALTAACLMTSGCLVTDPYEFPEAINEPPTLTDGNVGLKLSRILEITPDDDPGTLEFSVFVHDPDIDEVLYTRQRLISEDADPAVVPLSDCDQVTAEEPEVVPSGTKIRPLGISFSTEHIQPSTCYMLEVAISPAFLLDCKQLQQKGGEEFFGAADAPGNIAIGRWYIKRTDGSGEDNVVCPTETVRGAGLL